MKKIYFDKTFFRRSYNKRSEFFVRRYIATNSVENKLDKIQRVFEICATR